MNVRGLWGIGFKNSGTGVLVLGTTEATQIWAFTGSRPVPSIAGMLESYFAADSAEGMCKVTSVVFLGRIRVRLAQSEKTPLE
jgi:hypothetical protein